MSISHPGASIPGVFTFTIPYTDSAFIVASTTANRTLLTLPAGGKILGVTIKHSTAFAGTAVSAVTISVGDTNSTFDQYASAFDIFQATGATTYQDSSEFKSTTSVSSTVSAHFIANTNFGSGAATVLTQGSVDISVCWVGTPTAVALP